MSYICESHGEKEETTSNKEQNSSNFEWIGIEGWDKVGTDTGIEGIERKVSSETIVS